MKKTITDFDLNNKVVVLRCDLNVSLKDNKIVDDTRIKESLKTINYILEHKAKLIILSHLGKIKTEEDKINNNLKIVCDRLNSYINNKITFIDETRSNKINKAIKDINYGEGIMLQNTRYEDLNGNLESGCNLELAKYWASLGDIFINDAFGTLHRKHASNYGISLYLESGIGFLVEKELTELDKLDSEKCEHPFAVIMGGSKVSDKLGVINSLIDKVDYLFIGGAMAYTFLKSKDVQIGNSGYEKDQLNYCRNLLDKYSEKIFLPLDFNGSTVFSEESPILTENFMNISPDFIGMDIGPKTINNYCDYLSNVKTLFWNGPLGVYEFKNYQKGTKEIMNFVSKNIPYTILGGGDIVTCASIFGYTNKVSYISTGGGASLAYLENKKLPGLENIKDI